ncbi:MAG: pyruvate,water dikinase [Rickettsiales bacterium]|jgi:pyruvate,water dikinase
MINQHSHLIWFKDLCNSDIAVVGGKNASLGEMIFNLKKEGINVPDGFATTSYAYWQFLKHNNLKQKIQDKLLTLKEDKSNLVQIGKFIRKLFVTADFPPEIKKDLLSAYKKLTNNSVAVRSSATAEDLPDASFAGQLESFLNISGEEELLNTCLQCYASLFTDRAIIYRENNGFNHMEVALSIGIQEMVRSDKSGSGVMFSIDTETGFPDAVLINAAWGLGESVVQGIVDPDEYMVFKPFLKEKHLNPIIEKRCGKKDKKIIFSREKNKSIKTCATSKKEQNNFVLEDKEIIQLSRWASIIEKHYKRPMDMEWAKDGINNKLYIVQARPETVQSRKKAHHLKTYHLKKSGKLLVKGNSVGDAIATGVVCKLDSPDEIHRFPKGAILVTSNTDPDWMPLMKRAAAIVTDHGGRTSHAAIVSRELELPALVGCIDATKILKDGQKITVSCAQGDEGFVYDGIGEFTISELNVEDAPKTRTKVMLNLANPAAAMRWWRLPSDGVGLVRMEFIINNLIKIHPLALLKNAKIANKKTQSQIEKLTVTYPDKERYFVDTLAYGIGKIAAVNYPNPVIVRMSDFKTDEYAKLIGGEQFEPKEENPMIGWRGASRYYSDEYRQGFALECRAIVKAREEMGFSNIIIMIPFCRTISEAGKVLDELSKNGLRRGLKDLQIYVMCEIPSNVILADKFAELFDGFSIGSNDLTQLTLGVDRNSDRLSDLFSEDDEAVVASIDHVIKEAHKAKRKIGLCGQAPSDRAEFAQLLVKMGIDSISVTPDSFLRVKQNIEKSEK